MTGPEPTHFELGGVRFVADNRPGPDRGHSTEGEFVIAKGPPLIRFYKSLRRRSPKSILEVGMFEGGSMVLFDKLFDPDRLVGLDTRQPIPALEQYRESRPHIRTYYGLSQDDPALDEILADQFPDGIDLVTDDASHLYERTKRTFEIAFPHLKPGGLYVIEDWAWSHAPRHQNEDHPWYRRKALTNLVFELVVNLPRSTELKSVAVHRGLVAIEKAASPTGQIDLDAGMKQLRQRTLAEL